MAPSKKQRERRRKQRPYRNWLKNETKTRRRRSRRTDPFLASMFHMFRGKKR